MVTPEERSRELRHQERRGEERKPTFLEDVEEQFRQVRVLVEINKVRKLIIHFVGHPSSLRR